MKTLVWSGLVWFGKKSFAYGFDQKGAIDNNFLVFEAILPGVTNNQTSNRVILEEACPCLLLWIKNEGIIYQSLIFRFVLFFSEGLGFSFGKRGLRKNVSVSVSKN